MTGQTTWNKATVPAGTDPWNLVPDTKKAIESAGLVFNVANDAERTGLAALAPGGVLPIPTYVFQTDNKRWYTWDGFTWRFPAAGFLGSSVNAGATSTGTSQNTLVSETVDLAASRRIELKARVLARPDVADQYAEYSIWAGGLQLNPAYVMKFSGVELSESLEFTADHGSGVGGSTTFHLKCKLIDTGVPTALIKSNAFTVRLSATDVGIG